MVSGFDPGDDSYGLTVETQGNIRAIIALFFDQNNEPRWSLSVQKNELSSSTRMISATGPCPWCEDVPVTEVDGGTISLDFLNELQAGSGVEVVLHELGQAAWVRQEIGLIRLFGDTNTVPFY